MPLAIEYASKVITTVNTRLRVVPLGANNRNPPNFTITTTAAAVVGATQLVVTALPVKLWPGDRLIFNPGGTQAIVFVARPAEIAATTVFINDLPVALTTGAVATTKGSVYIAGVTDASPASAPKTIDTTNYLSGVGAEMAIVGTNRTLNLTFDRVEGDPGGQLFMDILYRDIYYDRECYAFYQRPSGELYEGACIATTGDQSGAVQDKATMTVNLQFQGSSFIFTPAPSAPAILWPA